MCLSLRGDADMVALAASAASGSWSWSSVGEGVERVVPGGVGGGEEGGGIIWAYRAWLRGVWSDQGGYCARIGK